MSVGHFARTLEAAGIPTVAVFIRAFKHHAVNMRLPRALVTRHPLGRALGAPGDWERQSAVVRAALSLLESAAAPATLIEFPETYRSAPGPSRWRSINPS